MPSTAQETETGRTGEFVQLLTSSQSRLYAYVPLLVDGASGQRPRHLAGDESRLVGQGPRV